MNHYTKWAAGIDYSMTSPAICVHPLDLDFHYNNCKFFCITDVKNLNKLENIEIQSHEIFFNDTERFENISNEFIDWMSLFDIDICNIEGYSMGSTGRIFNIAENAGLLKHKIYNSSIKLLITPPTEIKKFATNKGNAKKNVMEEAFIKETNINLKELLNQKPNAENPSSDLIDAYFICKQAHLRFSNQTYSHHFTLSHPSYGFSYRINKPEKECNLFLVEKIGKESRYMFFDESLLDRFIKEYTKKGWKINEN